jgi:hypothetical protein
VAERKVDARPSTEEDGEAVVLAKIAAMPEPHCTMGERLHALILHSAPTLKPTAWYGMPAYAKGGRVICFFRADKFMTFGLTDNANLALEPDALDQLRSASWFLDSLDEATEARIAVIVRKAAS